MGDGKGKGKEVSGTSTARKRKKTPFPPDDHKPGSRKQKRSGVLQFFDDVADVDEVDIKSDSDSDFLDDDRTNLHCNQVQPEDHHIPFFLKEETDDTELEKFLRQKYKKGSEYVVYSDKTKGSEAENSATQLTEDAMIWKVKCARGHERKTVLCLIQKFINLQALGSKLCIKSAFCVDHIKGLICVEADMQHNIIEACKGLFGIYANSASRIPCNELPHLLSVRGKSFEIIQDVWVRVKFGIYKGDLAKVIDVDETHRRATIKLIPRVDLQAIVDKTEGNASIKKTAAPAPRLISSYELEKCRQFIKLKRDRRTGEFFQVIGGSMLKDGYLYKKVRLDTLDCWDVRPSDVELERFKGPIKVPGEDPSWISKLYGEQKKRKTKEVNQSNKGKASSSFDPNEFKEWELFDLVLLGKKEFGVIIGIDGDNFELLKGNCERLETTTLMVNDIKKQRPEEKAFSLDHNSNKIFLNDIVKVLDGPFEGKQGIVKHIVQGALFIYDNNQTEANGFSCARPKSCEAIKYSTGSAAGNVFGSVPPAFEGPTSESSLPQTEGSPVRRREYPRAARRTGGDNADGQFCVGQRVRIRIGPLKGYICRVIAVYRSDITVKLDSQFKVIKVKSDDLAAVRGFDNASRDGWRVISAVPSDMPVAADAINSPGGWQFPDATTSLGNEQSSGGWEVAKKENTHQGNPWNSSNTTDLLGGEAVDLVNLSDNWNMGAVKVPQSGFCDKPTVDKDVQNQDTGTAKSGGETWGAADNTQTRGADAWGQPADKPTVVDNVQGSSWNKDTGTTKSIGETWGAADNIQARGTDAWGKPATGGASNNWGSSNDVPDSVTKGWNDVTGQSSKGEMGLGIQVDNRLKASHDENHGWGSRGNQWNNTEAAVGCQANLSGKATDSWNSDKDVSQNADKSQAWGDPKGQDEKTAVSVNQADNWRSTDRHWNEEKGVLGDVGNGRGRPSDERKMEATAAVQAIGLNKVGDQEKEKNVSGGDGSWSEPTNNWAQPKVTDHSNKAADGWGHSSAATGSQEAGVGGETSREELKSVTGGWDKQRDLWNQGMHQSAKGVSQWNEQAGSSSGCHPQNAVWEGSVAKAVSQWNERTGSLSGCHPQNAVWEGSVETSEQQAEKAKPVSGPAAQGWNNPQTTGTHPSSREAISWGKASGGSNSGTTPTSTELNNWGHTATVGWNTSTKPASCSWGNTAEGGQNTDAKPPSDGSSAWAKDSVDWNTGTKPDSCSWRNTAEGGRNTAAMPPPPDDSVGWQSRENLASDESNRPKGVAAGGWNAATKPTPDETSSWGKASGGWNRSVKSTSNELNHSTNAVACGSWNPGTKPSSDGVNSSGWNTDVKPSPSSNELNSSGSAATVGWDTATKSANASTPSESNGSGSAATGCWDTAAKPTRSEPSGWGSAATGGWATETTPTSNESSCWAKVSGGWNVEKDSNANPAKDDWQNPATKSWGKVGSWQQSSDQGPQSNAGESRPNFSERSQSGYRGRGRDFGGGRGWNRNNEDDQSGGNGGGGGRGGGRGWNRDNEDGDRFGGNGGRRGRGSRGWNRNNDDGDQPGWNGGRGAGGGSRGWTRDNEDGGRGNRGRGVRGWNRNNDDGDPPIWNGVEGRNRDNEGGGRGNGGRGGRGWIGNNDGDQSGWSGGRGGGSNSRGWDKNNDDGNQSGGDGGSRPFRGGRGWGNNGSGDLSTGFGGRGGGRDSGREWSRNNDDGGAGGDGGRGRGRGGRGWNNNGRGGGRGWMGNNDDRDKPSGNGGRGGGSGQSSGGGGQASPWQKSGNSENDGSQSHSGNEGNKSDGGGGGGQQSSLWSTWASAGGSSEKATDATDNGWGSDGDPGTGRSQEPANSENRGGSGSLPDDGGQQSTGWSSWGSAAETSSSKANKGSGGW